MSILSFDHDSGTFVHRCEACGFTDTLAIAPVAGHVAINDQQTAMMTRPCPHCAEHNAGGGSVECFFLHPPSWEADEGPHPGSLVGTKLPGIGGILNEVVEHTEGYDLNPHAVQQKRWIRQMQQHPHLAPHAPLRPDPPRARGTHHQWDGTWRPDSPTQSSDQNTK
jgi:hypothetical protein